MQRIQTSNNTDTQPTAVTGPNDPGYFQAGNPATGTDPTYFSPTWANGVQETLLDPIIQAGLTPDVADDTQLTQAIQILGGSGNFYTDTGSANTLAITVTGVASYAAGDQYWIVPAAANTGASTLNVNGLGAQSIKNGDGSDLGQGEIKASQPMMVRYDGTNFVLVIIQPAVNLQVFTASGTHVAPYTGWYLVKVWAAGASGGGARTNATTGAGGGSGGFSLKLVWLTQGTNTAVTVGAGGAASVMAGNAGGASSFGAHCSANGGSGGAEGTAAGTVGAGGAGGTATGGDLNLTGQDGQSCEGGNTGGPNGGHGGGSPFGGKGGYPTPAGATGANGTPGQIPGGGGGGGTRSTSNGNSGAGARGEVQVWFLG